MVSVDRNELKLRLSPELPHEQLKWRNDARIWRWCRQNHIITRAQQMEWLDRIEMDPAIQMFGIDSSKAGLVGTCGLTGINTYHRTAEFSLFIGPEYHGHGYSRPSLVLLLDYGFNRMNLKCIYGEVIAGNPALSLFLSVGFREEGIHHCRYFKHGKYHDAVSISITDGEYRKRGIYETVFDDSIDAGDGWHVIRMVDKDR